MAFKLKIVSSNGSVFDDYVDRINIVTSGGELTILPHHIPLVTTLKKDSRISLYIQNKKTDYYATSGVLTVKEKETVIIVDEIEKK